MDSIKYRTTDVFRYALPGMLWIVVFSLTLSEITNVKNILPVLIPAIDLKNSILMLFLGYFIGFAIDPLGRQIRYKIVCRIWKTPKISDYNSHLTDSEKYVLLKQFSDGNYSEVDTWNMLKGMACNFAVGTFSLIFVLIFKIYQNYPDSTWDWMRLIPFALLLTILLLHQSHNYEKWSINDLNAAIKILNLEEKAKKS